jgi:hypothetical protein
MHFKQSSKKDIFAHSKPLMKHKESKIQKQ